MLSVRSPYTYRNKTSYPSKEENFSNPILCSDSVLCKFFEFHLISYCNQSQRTRFDWLKQSREKCSVMLLSKHTQEVIFGKVPETESGFYHFASVKFNVCVGPFVFFVKGKFCVTCFCGYLTVIQWLFPQNVDTSLVTFPCLSS